MEASLVKKIDNVPAGAISCPNREPGSVCKSREKTLTRVSHLIVSATWVQPFVPIIDQAEHKPRRSNHNDASKLREVGQVTTKLAALTTVQLVAVTAECASSEIASIDSGEVFWFAAVNPRGRGGGFCSGPGEVDTTTPNPASLSRCLLLRHSSFIRAVCVDALVRICARATCENRPSRDLKNRI
jgi:hypothetical protein